jgi:hypothetical protein
VSTQTLTPPPTTRVAAVGGKVARTVLAVLLFLQGAILAAWALSWAGDELSEHGLVHVSYPAWAGAALWVVLFGAAVRATVVAGFAVWQAGWGPAGKIGASKINAAWTAVVVNAALVPGLALAATIAGPSFESRDIQNLFWFVVWGGAIAAALGFFALRPPLRWAGWRPVTKAMIACMILLIGAGIMFQDQRIGFADSLRDWFFPRPTASWPCLGAPNPSCAGRAARSVGGTVAWLQVPTGFAVEESLFVDGEATTETLRSTTSGAFLRLETNVPSGSGDLCRGGACAHHHRAVRVGNRTVTVRWGFTQGPGDFAVATWSRGGRPFSLTSNNPYGPVDLAWFENVLRSVQYATA